MLVDPEKYIICAILQENHVNLVHIESRKSKRRNSEFEIFVDCDSNHEQLNEIIQLLRKHVSVVDMEPPDNSCLHEQGKGVQHNKPYNTTCQTVNNKVFVSQPQRCAMCPGSQRGSQTWTNAPTAS